MEAIDLEAVDDASRDVRDFLASRRVELGQLISNGDWHRAAVVAQEAANLDFDNADAQRTASGVLLAAGEPKTALQFAQRALDLNPNSVEFAVHLGVVYNQCQDFKEAVKLLGRVIQRAPEQAEAYQQLSYSTEQLGNPMLAAKLAIRAYRLDSENSHRGIAAAHLLARVSRWSDAVSLLSLVEEKNAGSGDLHHFKSHFLMQLHQLQEALAEINLAIAIDPLQARYFLHKSTVLAQMGDPAGASIAIESAVRLDPSNLDARRHAVTLYVEQGELNVALRIGAELLALAPDHEEYASCMRFLLDAQSMSSVAKDIGEIAALKRTMPVRTFAEPTSSSAALRIQWRTISALVLRDIRSRYGESKIGFFWALMEPFIHIGVLAIVFQFTTHGHPPMGNNFFLFYYTGVMPYLLLSHLITHLGATPKSYKNLMNIPTVTPFDLIFAKSIVEMFTTAIIFLVFLALFEVCGVDALPTDPVRVILGFLVTWALGVGIGGFCAVAYEITIASEHVVSVLIRLLYFASGIFYVPSMMPLWVRNILVWNPFLNVVDYVRTGFFETYSPFWMDFGYSVVFSVFAMTVGLTVVFLYRNRLRMPA